MTYNINKDNLNIVPIVYNLLYQINSYEFLSELVHYSKFYFTDEELRKESIISLLTFALSTNKIIIEKVDSTEKRNIKRIYNNINENEFISIFKENWNEFNNSDEVLLWYSYQINYTIEWKNELKKINLWIE